MSRLQLAFEVAVIRGVGSRIEALLLAEFEEIIASSRIRPLAPSKTALKTRRRVFQLLLHRVKAVALVTDVSQNTCSLKVLQAEVGHEFAHDLWCLEDEFVLSRAGLDRLGQIRRRVCCRYVDVLECR